MQTFVEAGGNVPNHTCAQVWPRVPHFSPPLPTAPQQVPPPHLVGNCAWARYNSSSASAPPITLHQALNVTEVHLVLEVDLGVK